MPTTGGLQNAILSGKAIGCETIQLFTASPRQWRSKPLADDAIELFRSNATEQGIRDIVAHDSYLINLAAPEGEVREKSRRAFFEEMERAEALGISYLVTHMGAHLGEGIETGIERLIESIDFLHSQTEGYQVRVALETTAGQGTTLGASLDQFPKIFEGVKDPGRLVICMDTCHMFAAGYDLRTRDAYDETIGQLDKYVGVDKLKVVHCNDALKDLGSRVDRHAHIGEGKIGEDAFRFLLTDSRLSDKLFIIETPESETMHAVNLQRLRDLRDGVK